jgi:hypothetical protein
MKCSWNMSIKILNLLRLHERSRSQLSESTKTIIIHERFPYRFVQRGYIQLNGKPDFRLQKVNEYTKKYSDIYLFDNGDQMLLAIEDFEYTKWLDPDRVPCYVER